MPKHLDGEDSAGQFEDAFALAVRAAREKQGISQRRLAQLLAEQGLRLDSSAVARLEKRDGSKPRSIGLGEALVIATVLNMDLQQVIFELHPPRHHLAMQQRQQKEHLEYVMEQIGGLLFGYRETFDLLTSYPDLLADLPDESEHGVVAPTSVAGYYLWEAARLQSEIARGEWLLVRPNNEEEDTGFHAILDALTMGLIEDPLPEDRRSWEPVLVHPASPLDLDLIAENVRLNKVVEINFSEIEAFAQQKVFIEQLEEMAESERWRMTRISEGVYYVTRDFETGGQGD